jgi:Icc-related predicted phosphoesterase
MKETDSQKIENRQAIVGINPLTAGESTDLRAARRFYIDELMDTNMVGVQKKEQVRGKTKGSVNLSKLAIVRDHLVLVFASDSHLMERELSVPPGMIFVHCGDASFMGRDNVAEFDDWLGELPHRYKVYVPGNHDAAFAKSRLTNATVLINEVVEIAGLKFWGTPVTSVGPAFCVSSAEERRRIFAAIPDDTDVLVTHAAPYAVLDNGGGDPELRAAVDRVQPIIHSFGHIHAGPATTTIGNTLFVNAALLGPDGALRGQPVMVKLPRR